MVLLLAGVLSVALGAGAFVLLPGGWLGGSAEQTTTDVAAATPSAVTPTPAPAPAPTRAPAAKPAPAPAPRRAETSAQRASVRSPLAAAVIAAEGSPEPARRTTSRSKPSPAVARAPATEPAPAAKPKVSPDVAVFERPRPPSEPVAPSPEPTRLAQATRSIDDLPEHEVTPTPTPPQPKPESPQALEPATRVAEPKARPAPVPQTAKPAAEPKPTKKSTTTHIQRQRVPDVEVVSTVWHPDATRRIARLQIDGDEVIELHEGDTIAGGLVVTEIKLSGVTLKHDDVTISKRVGKVR
jgi:hypothetical protein